MNIMKLSERALNLTPSAPRKIYDIVQKYAKVIDLTLGDPDLPPPGNVQEAACRAICAGKTRYSANAGLIELRRAIADDAAKYYGMQFDPVSEVIVTVGAMQSAYLCLWSLLDPGDEAIIPTPTGLTTEKLSSLWELDRYGWRLIRNTVLSYSRKKLNQKSRSTQNS